MRRRATITGGGARRRCMKELNKLLTARKRAEKAGQD
jgi:hypothetical protein